MIENLNDSNEAVPVRIINCTPAQLRAIADRMEHAAKHAKHRDEVVYVVSQSVLLSYDPAATNNRTRAGAQTLNGPKIVPKKVTRVEVDLPDDVPPMP